MTEHLRLIARQLGNLQRMCEYLAYSTHRVQRILPINDWRALSLEQHETLAAFRVRFSEFQEHLGLLEHYQRLLSFCEKAYGIKPA